MRNKSIFYIAVVLVFSLFSCEMKKDLLGDIEDPSVPKLPENAGLLDLTLNAEKEAEYPTKSNDIETGDSLFADNFSIAVYDSVGTKVAFYETYAELKTDGGLVLTSGKYTMSAENGDNVVAGFDKPYYMGEDTFIIESKQVAKVETSCMLSNKKLQFRCSDSFLENYSEDYSVVLDNGIGVLTINKEETRAAYMQNTGVLRMNIYVTDKNGEPVSYLVDLGENEQVKEHNNLMVDLDIVENGGGSEPGDDGDIEPGDPGDEDKPDVPTGKPMIKVDVSLIEKDFVIEIPMDISGGNSGGDETPGDEDSDEVSISGTIDGKSFNINQAQTITASTKSVVINLFLPTGLEELKVNVSIGSEINLPLDLLDKSSVDEVNEILSSAGKKLEVPSKGDKGNLKFDISPFLDMLQDNNKFILQVKDANGSSANATLILNK